MSDKDTMAPEKPKGPIRKLLIGVKTHAAHQGWMIGLMDSAIASLEIVRDDARGNLQRVPSHKLSAEAERVLTKAISAIQDVAVKLQSISEGDNADG